VRVMLSKDGGAAQVTDLNPSTRGGEGSTSSPSPSPYAVLTKKSGLYYAVFLKTAIGSESYRGTVFCKTSRGGLLNPQNFKKIQDQ
jgi:hypothetical protein